MESGWWDSSLWIRRNVLDGCTEKDNWPEDEEYLESIREQWVEPFGDMRQELVFIGQNLDKKK